MSLDLYVAPPAGGKTAFCLRLVSDQVRGLAGVARVCVGNALQVGAWQARLADAGGAMGVRVCPAPQLYAEVAGAAGLSPVVLSEAMRYRLLRAALDRLPLHAYRRLVPRPGFVAALQSVIAELKEARISPEAFRAAVSTVGLGEERKELAAIYAAYQGLLNEHSWADVQELGALAVRAIEEGWRPDPRGWPLVVVDGHPRISPLLAAVLRGLADAGVHVVVTLECPAQGEGQAPSPPAWGGVEEVAARLGARPSRLPGGGVSLPAASTRLVAAPDRMGEVRTALRWLKARLAEDRFRPDSLALLVRSLASYRAEILEVAEEFGLPVRVAGGLPLAENPAVAAILDLLRLAAPSPADPLQPSLPRRLVLESWRSPYLDWTGGGAVAPDAPPVGMDASTALLLEEAALQGRVISSLRQWEEALAAWESGAAKRDADWGDAEWPRGAGAPSAVDLAGAFRRFAARVTPPAGPARWRTLAAWVEDLIGPEPQVDGDDAAPADGRSLRVAARVSGDGRAPHVATMQGDLAALDRLKDVLRGLVWAEEVLGLPPPADYTAFLAELVGAVDGMTYEEQADAACPAVCVAEVEQAYGVPARAVALLGLAEGEFPAPERDDPFLPDAERRRLRDQAGLALEPLLAGREPGRFAHALARPWEALLITRPRLAENGATWAESPFWEEVVAATGAAPESLAGAALPSGEALCSWTELAEHLAASGAAPDGPLLAGVSAGEALPPMGLCAHLRAAADVLNDRRRGHGVGRAPSPAAEFAGEGDLSAVAMSLAERYGPKAPWSASSLEAYRRCPFSFFAGSVLGVAPRDEPAEGLDDRQRGNVYHHILEAVYRAARVVDPADPTPLLEALPEVAARVLDAAPAVEGFRETAYWRHTRMEIEANVRRCILALADAEYAPYGLELRFWGPSELCVEVDGVAFRVRGLIDRVDRAPDGRLRIIDYKTGGSAYTRRALREGRVLQLPLYALAARDALALGEPAEGFYFLVQRAEPSDATLCGLEGGPEEAYSCALAAAAEAVQGARSGLFPCVPPPGGCPPFCPAAAFCWHYRKG